MSTFSLLDRTLPASSSERRSHRWRRVTAVAVGTAALVWAALWPVVREPRAPNATTVVVNDISQLNPISVAEVIVPGRIDEIVAAVRRHDGPISIGGARHSMGGQIALPGALHIDMRRFNRILRYSPKEKLITVQAGATWRQIQERIDSDNLSISIMQTYANFTVGGSLSVNVHGRYVGQGPIILSVVSFRIVMQNGEVVDASPTTNTDVFYGTIGGYGGLGVIADVTLGLTDNVRVKRTDRVMPIGEYREFFLSNVRDSAGAVFHNGDIYPDTYDTVHAVTYSKTDEPVMIADRLQPIENSHRLDRFAYWAVSEWPFGGAIRRYIIEPFVFRSESVTWRNYEASYDASELEPASRQRSTYVLQEYFVPVNRFDDFVPKMRSVFQRHRASVINVSIRHARQDPGSLLAWARSEVFAFVVYYRQGTSAVARQEVGFWTRELIDAALSEGGAFYLPYQLHATREQFLRAYPRAQEFFALKRRLDPTNKFSNLLWEKYYSPR
jgi:FAD/FMN-containing dehydrogenase